MAYSLHEDNLARDQRWMTLAKLEVPVAELLDEQQLDVSPAQRARRLARLKTRRSLLQAAYWRMTLEVAAQLSDGYIGLEAALECCDGETWILKALTTPACGKPPFLHRPGDSCARRNCINDSAPWTEGYEYRICGYLKRNPSRAEVDRNRSQKADLRDPRLKALVWQRDGGCCRYCRSGPLSAKAGRSRDRRKFLTHDHFDPDRDAGPNGENLGVCCARCGEYKGRRTPDEADMRLLPEPTEAERAAWLAREQMLFDRPDPAADQQQNTDETPTNHRQTTDPDVDPNSDPSVIPDVDPNGLSQVNPTGQVCPPNHEQDQNQQRNTAGKGPGRVGGRAADGDLPARHPDAPDIYHRRSRPPRPLTGPDPPAAQPPPPRSTDTRPA